MILSLPQATTPPPPKSRARLHGSLQVVLEAIATAGDPSAVERNVGASGARRTGGRDDRDRDRARLRRPTLHLTTVEREGGARGRSGQWHCIGCEWRSSASGAGRRLPQGNPRAAATRGGARSPKLSEIMRHRGYRQTQEEETRGPGRVARPGSAPPHEQRSTDQRDHAGPHDRG